MQIYHDISTVLPSIFLLNFQTNLDHELWHHKKDV